MDTKTLRDRPVLLADSGDTSGLLDFADSHKEEIFEDFDACWNTGWAIAKMQQPKLAKRFLRRAIELRPEHAMGPYALGYAMHVEGEMLLDEAESLYRKSMQLKEGWTARHTLAALLLERGRGDEGEHILRQGVVVRPNSRVRCEELADYLDDLGKTEEADLFREQASQLKMANPAKSSDSD